MRGGLQWPRVRVLFCHALNTGVPSSHSPREQSAVGEFQRQEDAFREWISNDGSTSYPAAVGRYHLYVSLACPWASRTVIFRKLKGLEARSEEHTSELQSQSNL